MCVREGIIRRIGNNKAAASSVYILLYSLRKDLSYYCIYLRDALSENR